MDDKLLCQFYINQSDVGNIQITGNSSEKAIGDKVGGLGSHYHSKELLFQTESGYSTEECGYDDSQQSSPQFLKMAPKGSLAIIFFHLPSGNHPCSVASPSRLRHRSCRP